MGNSRKHALSMSALAAQAIFYFVLHGYGGYSFGWSTFFFAAGCFFALWLVLYVAIPLFFASSAYFAYKEKEAKLEALYDLLKVMTDDDDDFDIGVSAAELKPVAKEQQQQQQPRRNEMRVNIGTRVSIGERLLDINNPVVVHRAAIATARKAGNLPSVTLGRLHSHVGANRTNGGANSAANQLRTALIDADFIDSKGEWTETGEAAFPSPIAENSQNRRYTGDIQAGIPVYTGIQGNNTAVSGGV